MSNIEFLEHRTCVVLRDEEVIFSSSERGISPLLYIIENGISVEGCRAFDRIVGKAAAMLYSYMRVAYVYAEVLSRSGLEVLTRYGIKAEYDVLTDKIVNRQGDGVCPMEKTVANIDSLESALVSLQSKSRELNKGDTMKNININDKRLGFGLMRLPRIDGEIDYKQCCEMVDSFIGAGFTYFDTAKGYLGEKSEGAFRECVAKRYPRESYTITDKLTDNYFNSEEDIRRCFEEQLKECGVEYFDYYLMHAQGKINYEKYKKYRAYEIAGELKAEGKIKHIGFSFHDSAEFLDTILSEHPEIELVQLQLNYVDYDDPGVQGRECLEVCRKYNKPVVVMEPVKGGNLVKLPQSADKVLRDLSGGSNASYAIRYAASFDNVFMVLSGMSDIDQMNDNLSYMTDFKPLSSAEYKAIDEVCRIFKAQNLIPCTACRYCIAGCPMNISIPDLFSDMNNKMQYHDWNADYYYSDVHTHGKGKASDCVGCGSCESGCPQHLEIRDLLKKVAKEFENK